MMYKYCLTFGAATVIVLALLAIEAFLLLVASKQFATHSEIKSKVFSARVEQVRQVVDVAMETGLSRQFVVSPNLTSASLSSLTSMTSGTMVRFQLNDDHEVTSWTQVP